MIRRVATEKRLIFIIHLTSYIVSFAGRSLALSLTLHPCTSLLAIVSVCTGWPMFDNAAALSTASGMDYASGTFYSYDIHGNVKSLLQDLRYGNMLINGNRFKTINYGYDLISGKVNYVAYQPGKKDAFYHRYSYDAANRLTNVETSHDSIYWENDAYYEYYKHGPLARTVIAMMMKPKHIILKLLLED